MLSDNPIAVRRERASERASRISARTDDDALLAAVPRLELALKRPVQARPL
jgi:hypothetical protein